MADWLSEAGPWEDESPHKLFPKVWMWVPWPYLHTHCIPSSNPEKRSDGHLQQINVPTLFRSGTRDTYASAEELSEAASKVPKATVHHLNGADHGFAVLKSSGRTRADVWAEAVDSLLSWISDI